MVSSPTEGAVTVLHQNPASLRAHGWLPRAKQCDFLSKLLGGEGLRQAERALSSGRQFHMQVQLDAGVEAGGPWHEVLVSPGWDPAAPDGCHKCLVVSENDITAARTAQGALDALLCSVFPPPVVAELAAGVAARQARSSQAGATLADALAGESETGRVTARRHEGVSIVFSDVAARGMLCGLW